MEDKMAQIHVNKGKKSKDHQNSMQESNWSVQASRGSMKTSNPIREIIETMDLAENPNKKLIPLSIGDPTVFGNLKPCQEILDALYRANSCGKHYGYQKASGLESARAAVADYHYRCTGNKVESQDIILASGCSHAIDLSICVLAGPGQNILIPRPGFPLYKTLTSVYGVQYKQYNLLADKNWSIDLEHLESLIDENTAAIVINNPSNPCGSVFSRKHLIQILELAERYRKPIISDEIYDKFVFSPEHYKTSSTAATGKLRRGQIDDDSADSLSHGWKDKLAAHFGYTPNKDLDTHYNDELIGWTELDIDSEVEAEHEEGECVGYVPFRSLSSLSDRVPILTCGGISKTCLIPGIRLGWIIINDRQNVFDASIRDGLSRLTQRLMGPNSLVQGALHDILTTVPETFYSNTMDFIFRNAKLCFDRLSLVPGLHPHMPQGSMYLMARFEAEAFPTIDGDLDFTSKLVNEESVLVLPGKCFDYPNYFRICLTVPSDVMVEALDRIGSFCERHYVRGAARVMLSSPHLTFKLNGNGARLAASQEVSQPLKSINLISPSNKQANKCK